MVRKLLVWIGLSILGLVLTLGWWTVRSHGRDETRFSKIPTKLWEGGGGKLTVEVELSEPGVVALDFFRWDLSWTKARNAEAEQRVPAGAHTFVVEVPPQTSASAEVRVAGKDATVGQSKIRLHLVCGQKEIMDETHVLNADVWDGDDYCIESPTVREAGTGEGM